MIEQKMPELGECADYVSISRVKRWEDGEKVPKYSIHIEGDYPDDGYKDNSVKFWNLYDWQVEFIAEQLNKADKLEKRLAEAEQREALVDELVGYCKVLDRIFDQAERFNQTSEKNEVLVTLQIQGVREFRKALTALQ